MTNQHEIDLAFRILKFIKVVKSSPDPISDFMRGYMKGLAAIFSYMIETTTNPETPAHFLGSRRNSAEASIIIEEAENLLDQIGGDAIAQIEKQIDALIDSIIKKKD